MRKISILLLICLMGFGLSACFHKQLWYSTYDLETFDSQELQQEDIPYNGQAIYVNSYIGHIRVIGLDDPEFAVVGQNVSIEAVMKVRDVPFEQLDLSIQVEEDEIQISASGPTDLGRQLKWTPPFVENKMAYFELVIRTPKDAEIHIDQELGVIELLNMGDEVNRSDIELQQYYGEILLSDSTLNSLSIEQQYGDIAITKTTFDDADVKTGYGNITVEVSRQESIRIEAKTGLNEISLTGVADGDPGVFAVMDRSWPGQELRLQQYDGDSKLELETRIGMIDVQFITE